MKSFLFAIRFASRLYYIIGFFCVSFIYFENIQSVNTGLKSKTIFVWKTIFYWFSKPIFNRYVCIMFLLVQWSMLHEITFWVNPFYGNIFIELFPLVIIIMFIFFSSSVSSCVHFYFWNVDQTVEHNIDEIIYADERLNCNLFL